VYVLLELFSLTEHAVCTADSMSMSMSLYLYVCGAVYVDVMLQISRVVSEGFVDFGNERFVGCQRQSNERK